MAIGRPRTSGDKFSWEDLGIAAAIGKPAVQNLMKYGLLPGDGGVRDLKRVATIRAFITAGLPLVMAGRMTVALLDEFNEVDGEAPSGLTELTRRLPARADAEIPIDNDFWYHDALWRRRDIYTPGGPLRSDAVVEIADREHVLVGSRSGLMFAPPPGSARTSDVEPIGRLENWWRGDDPVFIPFLQETPLGSDGSWTPAGLERRERMLTARDNAVGLFRVNISLSIRNSLDRLADYRASQDKTDDQV